MRVHDPIYGAFDIPIFLDEFIFTPEVRRLSEIRLLNTLTPSLATLGEIRRFSHTLGVVHLAMQNSFLGASERELKALLVSILVHDAGTPPFAHLMEYHLADKYSWSHEEILSDLLEGTSNFSNTALQIHRGHQIRFKEACRRKRIDFDLVQAIVEKKHPLSNLLFGQLDFDNLDNVIRMAWALGLKADKSVVLNIASKIAVNAQGRMILSRHDSPLISQWAGWRRAVYEILIFDQKTVAAQAVLSKAIAIAMEGGHLSSDDWQQTDEQLISKLANLAETKELIQRQYFGVLPHQIFAFQFGGTLGDAGFKKRQDAVEFVEAFVRDTGIANSPTGYVFVDKGAFEKRLDFWDSQLNQDWGVGESSRSVVFYCFGFPKRKLSKQDDSAISEEFKRQIKKNECS